MQQIRVNYSIQDSRIHWLPLHAVYPVANGRDDDDRSGSTKGKTSFRELHMNSFLWIGQFVNGTSKSGEILKLRKSSLLLFPVYSFMHSS